MHGVGRTAEMVAGLAGSGEPGTRRAEDAWLGPEDLEFVGCEPLPMSREEIESPEWEGRRVEYWDAATETAWVMREALSAYHEAGPVLLVKTLERIAMFRGAPIECMGGMDLRFRTPDGEILGFIEADQLVYLHSDRAALFDTGEMVVGKNRFPDVVLEVDNTTDVRRNKLRLYEGAGFPEVWVEVPDRRSRSAAQRRSPGLRIHLLEGGRYREAAVSRAFPGWTASEIHTALNEPVLSFETDLALERVGRQLGRREGGVPEDDLALGRFGRQKRAEGHAEGRAEGVGAMAARSLRLRGVALSPDFPADLPPEQREALRNASAEAVAEAAYTADSQADFFARLEVRG